MDTLIILNKINEAQVSLNSLSIRLERIHADRKRLDDEELSIEAENKKLNAKIEAWNELMPQTINNSSPVHSTDSHDKQKRNRRPSGKWLKILRQSDGVNFKQLWDKVSNLNLGIDEKSLKDQIRRYLTNEDPLLIEISGIYYLADKSKVYLREYFRNEFEASKEMAMEESFKQFDQFVDNIPD